MEDILERYKIGKRFELLGKPVNVTGVGQSDMIHYGNHSLFIPYVEVGWWSGDELKTKRLEGRNIDLLV